MTKAIAPKKPSLIDIASEKLAIEKLLEDNGGDLDQEFNGKPLAEWLETYDIAERDKLDRICYVVAAFEADAALCAAQAKPFKDEAKRLSERVKQKERRADRLKESILVVLKMHGVQKVEAPLHTVWRQGNGGEIPVIPIGEVDPKDLPERFRKTETVYSMDKEAVRKALLAEDPEAQKYAILGEVGEHLRIK
jgi:hypothetical protein